MYPPAGESEPVRPLLTPSKFLLYPRDLATMTPGGLVLCNLGMATRNQESALLRFLLTWSPELAEYPVAFDAAIEGVQLQGGDLIVADSQTLLVGVGNLTEERVAPLLAEQLEMNVIAVSLPGPGTGAFSGGRNSSRLLRSAFLHLDSIFSFVDTQTFLTVPWFLDSQNAGRDPFSSLMKGLVRAGYIDPAAGATTLNQVKQIGLIRRYVAGTGEVDPTWNGKKLIDYLRSCRMKPVYVGGPPGDCEPVEHLVENVLYELRFQAANVLTISPGHVLMPESNRRTNQALQAAGIKVATFPASELVRWHGGAHCMTLPLERASA